VKKISTSPPQARELLELISDGFLFVDRDFRIQEISAEGVRMANRPRSDIVGGILWDQAPRLRDGELGQRLVEALEQCRPVALEYQYQWPHGAEAWLEIRAFPSQGGLAVFYRNISDRKRSEEDLNRAQFELMHASRLSAMGTMAATLAHELAQPLTSAGNAIEAGGKLLRGLGTPKAREARQALDLAGNAVQRAGDLVRRLRAFVAKGRVEAATEDLATIIADASVLIFPEARRKSVEIGFELDPRAKWVTADAVQIQQVLINLLGNAIHAISDAPQRHIKVTTAAISAEFVEVTVEDNGPGLAPAMTEEIFARFHSGKTGGLGVGLSICRTIVEAHGGTIEADSGREGGALFRFTLPRAAEPA
jgi:two-component system, LuxR family, sensor kinase FixL